MSFEKMMDTIQTAAGCFRRGVAGANLSASRYSGEEFLLAAGFAEYHPVDDNSIPEGRARNRRIDIVILNPALQEKSPFATPPAAPTALPLPPETPANPAGPAVSPAPARQ
jgi:hypothetical protein